MPNTLRRVVSVSPLRLGAAWPVRREPPRPLGLRQADYLDGFDDDTLVYDAFPVGETLRLIGPPMLNLSADLTGAVWRVDGTEATPHLHDLDRTQRSWLEAAASGGERLTVTLGDARSEAEVSPSGLDWFRDRRALVTKSKDNDLAWVSDWARFHAAKQGVDAVLLYDNGSTRYRPEDVLEAIAVPGIEVAVVVSWPFEFGPQGGSWDGLDEAPWDSDFCEYGVLEHARHRFLAEAAGVLNHDIDELAVSEDAAGVFDLVATSETGAIRFPGRWIDTPRVTSTQPPRFADFTVYDITQRPSTSKWAIDPRRTRQARQWKTHSLPGVTAAPTDRIRHRHFAAITSNWKYDRATARDISPAVHRQDVRLADALADVFGPDAVHPVPGVVDPSTVTARLGALEHGLDARRRLGDGLRRVWHRKAGVVSLDYESVHGARYGFDIEVTRRDIGLELAALDEASWYAVRDSGVENGPATGTEVLDSARRIRFGRWSATTPMDEVVGDLIARIQRTNTALNSPVPHLPRAIAAYWQPTDFCDEIGPWLLEAITGRTAYNTIGRPNTGEALMTIGSLINGIQRPGLTIWGSGLLAPLTEDAVERLRDRPPEAILAVRGARTRRQLVKHLGWEVPEVYGDPALLMPYVFRPGPRPPGRTGLSVIPHHAQSDLLTEALGAGRSGHLIDVRRSAEAVVEEIAQSEVVISSSLHGLILAQAYGIPWVWLRITGQGPAERFPYSDFFTTLEKESVASVSVTADVAAELDLEQVASMAALPASRFDPLALVEALPYEIREDFRPRIPRPRRSGRTAQSSSPKPRSSR